MKRLLLGFIFSTAQLLADPLPNVLVNGNVQVNASIYQYADLEQNAPLPGSVMVTHDANAKIDVSSFQIGDKPLKTTFMQEIPMDSYSNLVVSIYSFQLEGLPPGVHTLPPIHVKIGGKDYQAPPITVQIQAK